MHDFYTSFTSIKKNYRICIFLKLTSEYISFWNYLYITLYEIFFIVQNLKQEKKHTNFYISFTSTKKTSNIRISFWNYSTLYETFVLLYNNENQELKISWQI